MTVPWPDKCRSLIRSANNNCVYCCCFTVRHKGETGHDGTVLQSGAGQEDRGDAGVGGHRLRLLQPRQDLHKYARGRATENIFFFRLWFDLILFSICTVHNTVKWSSRLSTRIFFLCEKFDLLHLTPYIRKCVIEFICCYFSSRKNFSLTYFNPVSSCHSVTELWWKVLVKYDRQRLLSCRQTAFEFY